MEYVSVDAGRGGELEPRPQPAKGIVRENKMKSQHSVVFLFFF